MLPSSLQHRSMLFSRIQSPSSLKRTQDTTPFLLSIMNPFNDLPSPSTKMSKDFESMENHFFNPLILSLPTVTQVVRQKPFQVIRSLAACYLINYMSSSGLHNKISHFILFPNQPLFCLSPRIFGCVCFVYILSPGQDKLSTKATKYVFLDYSRLQRGYRCYSPDTHRHFVSTDITFLENSSMFPVTHPPHSDVISLPLLYPIPDTSHVPPSTPPRPLQVYTRYPRTNTRPPTDSSPMAPSSTTPVLSSPIDLPITIRKGIHSSRKPHLIYNFPTYHRLSSPYSVFVSTLSYVSIS